MGFFVCELMSKITFLNNCKEIQIRLSAQDKKSLIIKVNIVILYNLKGFLVNEKIHI